MLSSYDPKLDSEIAFWNDKLAEFRGMKADYQTRGAGRNLINLTKQMVSYTNRNAILRAVRYSQETIRVLDNMKLVPEINQNLIDELRKNIPDPWQYDEVQGERKIEADAADVNTHNTFASDSQLDWEIKKLDEMVERVRRHNTKPKTRNKTAKALKAQAQRPKAGRRPPLEKNDASMTFLKKYWGQPERYW